jgi:hypothetical protein
MKSVCVRLFYNTVFTLFIVFYAVKIVYFVEFIICSISCCLSDTLIDPRNVVYCNVVYACMFVCICVYIFVCMYICIYVHMYVCIYVCVYLSMYVCININKYIYIYIYARARACVCMCMYVCTNPKWIGLLFNIAVRDGRLAISRLRHGCVRKGYNEVGTLFLV